MVEKKMTEDCNNDSDERGKAQMGASAAVSISLEERAARWAIWRVRGVGFVRLFALVNATDGNIRGLFGQNKPEQESMLDAARVRGKIRPRLLKQLQSACPSDAYSREVDALGADGQLLMIGDAGYPRELLDLRLPPVFVYLRGSFDAVVFRDTVAVVGSRAVQYSQAELARRIAGDLARAGVATVSGGALGVDAAAHQGCLDAGAPSVAVLAGGVERPTPRRNAAIFERIVAHGALLSEYPLGVKPRAYHFQRRNELIAALGRATVVVRAGIKSGTMLTARAAAELGRPICAVPGAPDEALAAGCNQLLVEGAACVRDAQDILSRVFDMPRVGAQLSLDSAGKSAPKPTPMRSKPARKPAKPSVDLSALSKDARALFEMLAKLAGKALSDVGRDELKRKIDWPESRLCPAILELELGGAIQKQAGANRYRPA